jgi:hypothetical protein
MRDLKSDSDKALISKAMRNFQNNYRAKIDQYHKIMGETTEDDLEDFFVNQLAIIYAESVFGQDQIDILEVSLMMPSFDPDCPMSISHKLTRCAQIELHKLLLEQKSQIEA